jgi:serine/threonine protein kinase
MPKSKQIEFITTFSRFRSIRLLGEGGAGFVYEVKDDNEQRFALKILKKQGITDEKRKRFKNEIIFCQRSSHPNIISILDHGIILDENIPVPFYIMPLYDSSLRNLITTGLKPQFIVPFISQLLDGVEAAHLQNIVHRDLKPENILFRNSDTQLTIADFGIARFLEEELYTAVETKAHDRLANFQYAAPEQRTRGTTIDHRADIFAIGLILNEIFTGQIPQGTGYRTISSVSPDFSYLDDIVAKMIRQIPSDRPNSISDVKQILKNRGADYVSEQKLSQLKSIVIPASEIDDPLVVTLLKITGFDWSNGLLTLILSQPVNQKWRSALLNMGSYTSVQGGGPERFEFKGNHALIRSEERSVQAIINYFKSWIPLATRKYEQDLRDERSREEKQRLQEIKMEIEEEEVKVRLRQNIKI